MKQFIVCLLLGALFGGIPPPIPGQQNQSSKHAAQEIQALKNRVSKLEKQLQIVENVEKLELQAKLSEANTKLLNAEFGKFERGLRDSNDEWLIKWGIFILAIVSVVGVAFWFALKSLIANGVEKNLDGFKEAVGQVELMKNQLADLEEAVVYSMLERTFEPDLGSELDYPRESKARREDNIKGFREETLVKVFHNEKYLLAVRHKAAEILARKSPPLISPAVNLLNLALDSDSETPPESEHQLRYYVYLLGKIHTAESCQALKGFLVRQLTEKPKHRDLFLTWTVFSLGLVSVRLDMKSVVPILKAAIPHMKQPYAESQALRDLAKHFDIFDEPEGIKEIMDHHGPSLPSEVIDRCLELLQKHDPAFVETWRTQNAQDNTESS